MQPFHFLFAPILSLVLVLPGVAQAQTRAECEYRNPDHPNWNYMRACTVTTVEAGDRVTATADVDNGSTITVVEEGTGDAMRFVVNGHAATRLESGASRCYLTIDDEETICIHGDGAVVTAAAPDTETGPDVATAPGPVIGGGEDGQCLAWVSDGSREGLIAQGACTRRTDCAEVEGEDGMSCLIDFVWEEGRETVVTSRAGVYTLDGAVALPGEGGCFTDAGAGISFCFSLQRMTEAAYPALTLPVAPEPGPLVAALDATGVEDARGAAPATTGSRCSFLRDDVEVSSWSCTEAIACEPPICTVTYAFENGTSVTLDTADGQVMLMNGAKADPTAWVEGAVVDVTRPGAPYTFRFTPGAQAASAE